jgi:hypothetical protein
MCVHVLAEAFAPAGFLLLMQPFVCYTQGWGVWPWPPVPAWDAWLVWRCVIVPPCAEQVALTAPLLSSSSLLGCCAFHATWRSHAQQTSQANLARLSLSALPPSLGGLLPPNLTPILHALAHGPGMRSPLPWPVSDMCEAVCSHKT